MKVSIVIPCYNDGAYLMQAVDSALRQTHPDLEVLVVNDGSDDPQTLEALSVLPPDVRVLHVPHSGPAHARNAGIAAASGAYILPLDADDRIEPAYVEKAAGILDSQEHVGIVYCLADKFGDVEEPWALPPYSLTGILTGNMIFVTALFRKSDWQHVGGFSEALASGLEDYDFFLSLIDLKRDVVRLPEVLFHYRIHANSRSQQLHSDMRTVLDMYDCIYDRHRSLFEQNARAVIRNYREILEVREDAISSLRSELRIQAARASTPPEALGMRQILHYLRIWIKTKWKLLSNKE